MRKRRHIRCHPASDYRLLTLGILCHIDCAQGQGKKGRRHAHCQCEAMFKVLSRLSVALPATPACSQKHRHRRHR
eukprot:7378437-Prymnesium_polylepis.1